MYNIAILIIWLRGMAMRKTTVMIDEKLLEEAVQAIGARTKKEAIEAGLRSLIQRHNREALRKELGTFDMDLTLEELERLRNAG
jgi:Arc/MetJ family transcription regulator